MYLCIYVIYTSCYEYMWVLGTINICMQFHIAIEDVYSVVYSDNLPIKDGDVP